MCGIVGYVGHQPVFPILMKGLQRLEYRGYDSTGVAILNGDLKIYKQKGKVKTLGKFVEGKEVGGTTGMGHTRWATHGAPNNINAHPHTSGNGKLALIHNGIIENYAVLKKELEGRGHVFHTDTDTEVLVHFIEEIQDLIKAPLEQAVRVALQGVVGAYAIVVVSTDEPGRLVAARKSSPLVVGIGEGEYFLASDATPIIEHTRKVVYLKD
ncbi:MAG: glutamine--fructose-6-phosphate aminotransferase, partial [Chitinophagales bacterium]